MDRYISRSTAIEAFQFKERNIPNHIVMKDYYMTDPNDIGVSKKVEYYYVVSTHGQREDVVDGDYIITDIDGIHHYPCKPDIFENRYIKI